MHISLREALLGFERRLAHLDGHVVVVTSRGVTRPFEVRVVEGEGMPVHNFPSQRGSLHVKFVVDFPARLTPEQQGALREVFP